MGNITKRINEFRGINRTLRPGAIDLSYSYDAVNVDIVGGMLTNQHVGSSRAVLAVDMPIVARPLVMHVDEDTQWFIFREKFTAAQSSHTTITWESAYSPVKTSLVNVENDTDMYILGCCESPMHTRLDDDEVVIVPQLLASSQPVNPYMYRNRVCSHPTWKTGIYYFGPLDPLYPGTNTIHCRQFGSGLYLFKNKTVTGSTESGGKLTSITIDIQYSELTDAMKAQLVADGVYLFSALVNANDDDYDNELANDAYMWLRVTSVESGTGGNAKLNVKTTKSASDLESPSYAYLRGGCSNMPISHCCMFYGRMFACGADKYKRRLYWSRLPGDGRTIEDWTMDDASVDTSGGHVDFEQAIETIIVCGGQLLIFTTSQLWRLYGTTPSTYTLERVCDIDHPRISNPVESNGSVYWLATDGVTYYNGSYVTVASDANTRNFIASFSPAFVDALEPTAVEANVMDGSILFSFDIAEETVAIYRGLNTMGNSCMVLRYNIETGNMTRYKVPFAMFNQQFTDVITANFGVYDGTVVQYETRYFQTMCNYTSLTLTFTMWRDWGRQDFGWYDNQAVKSLWQSGWTDMQTPEAVKKIQTICLRGSGEFTLTIESEHNKESIEVKMPDNEYVVKELTPRYAEGRTFRITIESEKPFSIEPNMTLMFEYGGKR